MTFKENCPDVRNTKVVEIVRTLKKYGINVDVYDPVASYDQVKNEFDIEMLDSISDKYDSVILAVAHNIFQKLSFDNYLNEKHIIYDIKSFLNIPVTKRL